ncbi:MAG TPA: EamA family transporter [Candidatus Avamphibacillus sp.]|nr:EamA family transporter [Candidatus Avamphibacillus sp.]
MILYTEPVIAIIIAWVWLQELPNFLSLIGGTIAISSVVIVSLLGRRRQLKDLNG